MATFLTMFIFHTFRNDIPSIELVIQYQEPTYWSVGCGGTGIYEYFWTMKKAGSNSLFVYQKLVIATVPMQNVDSYSHHFSTEVSFGHHKTNKY